ncbi:MAG: Hsp33 family molecular chaperone HslO [Alphaproteobacteria bacterium]|nr:Hsp33 family molecular chaperone HslO [Alphaproteobacteria bacterium]
MTEHPGDRRPDGPRRLDDLVLPFQIEGPGLRGRLVRLGDAVDTILKRHDYPPAVAALLAEALALAATLSAALKYEGIFTLQLKGDGPVRMLVTDVTSAGAIRGYAEVSGDLPDDKAIALSPVRSLVGKGYLAFTVDQGEHTERYQGIVELIGDSLTECIDHYFKQSEQFSAALQVTAGQNDAGKWRAGAMMLQRLPDQEAIVAIEERDEAWRRSVILMSSVTATELLDPVLAPAELLFRLFHEDGVRVYDQHMLAFGCRCSHERAARILASLPRDEVEELVVDGKVSVTCQFCNETQNFGESEIAGLYEA